MWDGCSIIPFKSHYFKFCVFLRVILSWCFGIPCSVNGFFGREEDVFIFVLSVSSAFSHQASDAIRAYFKLELRAKMKFLCRNMTLLKATNWTVEVKMCAFYLFSWSFYLNRTMLGSFIWPWYALRLYNSLQSNCMFAFSPHYSQIWSVNAILCIQHSNHLCSFILKILAQLCIVPESFSLGWLSEMLKCI